jgi:hypothetical protein
MLQPSRMPKVGAINRELIIGFKLSFERVIRVPRIITARFQHKHSVIDCRAWKVAEHVCFWRRRVCIGVRCEYDVLQAADVVEFGSPQIVGVCFAWVGIEHQLYLCVVPVSTQRERYLLKSASEAHVKSLLR